MSLADSFIIRTDLYKQKDRMCGLH